ncbi:tRNA (cytidine(34)-2'-O)-methyltransferase [Afifella marina]|uniref:tRNA (cytidine(34)-2'-O)-methyltransferase n=1 Tax=Afifella marina DSM 2698 TaxID=1120955 RepID=A0A1G5P349_AFIMA|nr:tRNA (cytidine(34)-2'-O)-methyltransferase [Afifella marina]MBK1624213.1 tRNA (cytidine(34)-2'-O)-methyltransferase [Afifella marina DSM 2698]MBK1627946.1 tRNA (cytidine(34)-2'-O)-methyltransferase [Afifella marina]MBK5918140.1 tRNA methyltransferase [Afifella marina]RAI19194.1 tRNA methyltransferase [Afifella marina DSM 2698]SCZ43688.1 tRNA (cytidine/uridine-2'-O-)-methyltransferase [Afifella marina DSM 2698]
MIDIALFQPDIPQNAGAILRLGACFGATVHIIHPAGFVLSDRNLKRAGMDYVELAALREHDDFAAFEMWRREAGRRLVALTTHGRESLPDFAFTADDILLLGRESAGLPSDVRGRVDRLLRLPIRPATRSLNVANAASIALFEALRQTGGLPSST